MIYGKGSSVTTGTRDKVGAVMEFVDFLELCRDVRVGADSEDCLELCREESGGGMGLDGFDCGTGWETR